jgi:Mg-chelatase subunit ChlD
MVNENPLKIPESEKIETINDEKLCEDMDLIFILDRSGSMYGSERDTINGFNSFIEKQRIKHPNNKVTLILFDNDYEVIYSQKQITNVETLTTEEYYVRGSTALLDAIGKTISNYERTTNKTLCIITTDGLENSSNEYSRKQIKNMIESSSWEFIYIGAEIDSYTEAGSIGIRQDYIANYEKTSEGTDDLFDAIDYATDDMVCYSKIVPTWKRKLD